MQAYIKAKFALFLSEYWKLRDEEGILVPTEN